MLDIRKNFDVLEKILINFLLDTGHCGEITDENNIPIDRFKLIHAIDASYFKDTVIYDIFKITKEHVNEYGKIPTPNSIWSELDLNNYNVDREEFDVILSYDLSTHNKKLLYKYIRGFILMNNLNHGFQQMSSHLRTSSIDFNKTDEIYDYVRNKVNDIMQIDISDSDDGLDVFNPESHVQPTKSTVPTGFPFLDKILGGGWEKKTFVVFQGRPKVGKSLVLSNLAVRGCLCGANTAVITVELMDCKYVKRIGSNLLKIPYNEYKNFTDKDSLALVHTKLNEFKNRPSKVTPGHLLIKEYPTGVPSSIDIENYLINQEQRRGIKFDLVIIDYLNLLRPYKSDSTLYEKVKAIAQELRAIAQRNDWTVVSATQVKVNDYHNDLRLDSASESSGLVATVDSLFGIIGEPGSNIIKLKNIANRDEGGMESWKLFEKVWEHFKIQEINTEEGEYWTDQPDKLSDYLDHMYKSLEIEGESRNPQIENQRPDISGDEEEVEYTSIEPEEQIQPNYDFDNGQTTVFEFNEIPAEPKKLEQNIPNDNISNNDVQPTTNINHDDILDGLYD